MSSSSLLALAEPLRLVAQNIATVVEGIGVLIVAIPAPDDLIELRAAVQGAGVERDRVDGLIEAHAEYFDVARRAAARQRTLVGRAALADLLKTTYRGARRSEATAVTELTSMDVTFASEIVVFRKK